MGIGEAIIDAVLLATTFGIGNAAKVGVKAGAKAMLKTFLKETGENVVTGLASEEMSDRGIPTWVQIAGQLVLGVKRGKGKKQIAKQTEEVLERINPNKIHFSHKINATTSFRKESEGTVKDLAERLKANPDLANDLAPQLLL